MIDLIVDGQKVRIDGRIEQIVRLVLEDRIEINGAAQAKIEFNCSGSSVKMGLTRYYQSSIKRSDR